MSNNNGEVKTMKTDDKQMNQEDLDRWADDGGCLIHNDQLLDERGASDYDRDINKRVDAVATDKTK